MNGNNNNDNIKQFAYNFVYNYIANAFVKSNFNGCESDYFKRFGHKHLAKLVNEITNAYDNIMAVKTH